MFFKIDVLKILQYSQENACVGALLNKVAGLYRPPLVAASVISEDQPL